VEQGFLWILFFGPLPSRLSPAFEIARCRWGCLYTLFVASPYPPTTTTSATTLALSFLRLVWKKKAPPRAHPAPVTTRGVCGPSPLVFFSSSPPPSPLVFFCVVSRALPVVPPPPPPGAFGQLQPSSWAARPGLSTRTNDAPTSQPKRNVWHGATRKAWPPLLAAPARAVFCVRGSPPSPSLMHTPMTLLLCLPPHTPPHLLLQCTKSLSQHASKNIGLSFPPP
jgi:hypothetical protein